MIVSFADKDTERIWNNQRPRGLPHTIAVRAKAKLQLLNAASATSDLRVPPGNRYEELRGNLKGRHSIRVNDQFRVTFAWNPPHASDVKIEDYH